MKLADIHCHILPGIDDGSRDFLMSMEMLRQEAREGVDCIILTPHFKPEHRNAPPEYIQELTWKLQDKCDEEQLGIELYIGNEIKYFDDVPGLLERGDVCTLADSQYALIEFSPVDPYKRIRSAVYEVQAAGFVPVIAHVERYLCLFETPELIGDLAEMGAMIQVNASSVSGGHGFEMKRVIKTILRNEWADFVATDAHDPIRRAPRLRECCKKTAAKFGDAYARRLFSENARLIISPEEEDADSGEDTDNTGT